MRATSFRIQLHAQAAPLEQTRFFTHLRERDIMNASLAVEPNTEPPCDHPEAGWQKDLFDGVVYCCTFCGAELPEPEVERAGQ